MTCLFFFVLLWSTMSLKPCFVQRLDPTMGRIGKAIASWVKRWCRTSNAELTYQRPAPLPAALEESFAPSAVMPALSDMKKKTTLNVGFTEQSGFKKNFFYLARLLDLLLLVCRMSPLLGSSAPKSETLLSRIASFRDSRIVFDKYACFLACHKGDRPVKYYRELFGLGGRCGDKRRRGDRRNREGNFNVCGSTSFLG